MEMGSAMLERTEAEVLRLGGVGQQFTNQVDVKIKEIEGAIAKVQAVELDIHIHKQLRITRTSHPELCICIPSFSVVLYVS